jgi:hypothetical protein
MSNTRKKPLFRRVNSRARGVCHGSGQRASYARNTKAGPSAAMKSGQRHGLDYTPLFRFLLSRVGQDWDTVYSEAKSRLDRDEAVFWIVARTQAEEKDVIRVGESSYYSGLYIDADGLLQKVAPELGVEHLNPQCPCCTHTFNGKRFPRRFDDYPAKPLVLK